MIKKIRRFLESLRNEQLDFQTRLIRMVFLLVFIATVIGMGRVLIGASPIVLTALIPMCIISGASLYIAVRYNKVRLASWLLILISN